MKVKKWLLGLITFAAMVVICAVCAGAETYGDFEYSVLDNGTVEITGYNGSAEKVDIPEKIDGKNVTSIGKFAFSYCDSLTSITIPDSVTSIGESAFNGCTSLTSITIPDSVTSIGGWAFSGCTSIKSITIPDSVTEIGRSAFIDCTSLTSITIPDSVTEIGDYAFHGCSSLTAIDVEVGNNNYTSVNGVLFNKDKTELICYPARKTDKSYNIPDSVTSIGDSAFYGCTSLTSIRIPNGVTSIGESAFDGCINLTSITIPNSVTSIGGDAFEGCTSLTSITIPNGVTKICASAFSGCTSLTSITIPNSVTEIGSWAFYGCTSLTSITIPDGVTSIGYRAFSGCTSLTSITIPNSVTSIGNWAFESCTSLTTIDVEIGNNNYTSVNGVLFNKDKTELICYPAGKTDKSYNIPDSVTSIGESAFEDCTSLTSIMIPDSVTEIGSGAFSGCTSLTNITIPDSVTSIGESAFNGCTSLTSITIPDSVTSIGDWAFEGTALLDKQTTPVKYADSWVVNCDSDVENVMIKKGTKGIANRAFSYCDSLTSITIPDSVTSIGGDAFSHCTSLTSITIPDSVTSISDSAFSYCTSLTSITIPDSVTWIGNSAFSGCSSLTSVTIPDGVTSIGESAFSSCSSLTAIDVEVGNNNYTSVNGVLFNKGKTELICYPAGKTDKSYNIPNSVTSIGYRAFSGCTSLTSITISNSVTSIGYYAFYGCTSLTSITIPNSVTSIGYYAFYGCTSLTSVTIPDNVTSIRDYTFSGCTSLTSITIPDSVTSIGDWAFGYYYDNGYKKIDNFKIYCYTGTAGEKYAKDKGFEYELLDHTQHTFGEWKTAKAATCTETGTQTRTCSVCGEVETQTIKALGHTVVVDKAVAATCTKTGLTEGKHCSVCNTVIKAQEVVPATGKHSFGDWKITKAATCTAEGTQTRTCSVCGKVETATIAKVAHKYVDTVVKPTYTAQGYTLHKCSVCGASSKDTYTAKLTLEKVTGVKLGGRAADALRVNWCKNASADGYIVEMYQGNKWVRVAKITNNSTTTFRKAGLKAGTAYKFRVRAYKMSGSTALYGNYSATVAARTNPSVMTGVKLGGRAADALRINWTKNVSADGYIVEMYQGNKWVRVAKITSGNTTTFRKAGLSASTVYKFRVRAYKMSGKTALYGNYSATVTSRTNPSVMTGVKIGGKAKDALRVNWTKNASAQGYIVEMYKGGKWVRVAKITNGNTTTFRKSGLAKNTTYKFRVCAYYMSGKTALYGGYGSVSGKTAAK